MKQTIKYHGEDMTLKRQQYQNGGVALTLDDEEGFPYTTATVWVPGLKKGEVAIKDYAENEGMLATLIQHGIVKPPHRTVASGFVTIPVCYLEEGGK